MNSSRLGSRNNSVQSLKEAAAATATTAATATGGGRMDRSEDHRNTQPTKRKKPKTAAAAAATNTKVKAKAGVKKSTTTFKKADDRSSRHRQALVVDNSAAAVGRPLPPQPSRHRCNYREECVPYLPPQYPAYPYSPWSPQNYLSSYYPHPDHPYVYPYPHPHGMPDPRRMVVNVPGGNALQASSELEVIDVDDDEDMVCILEGGEGGGGGEAGSSRESSLGKYSSLAKNVGGVNGRKEPVEVSNPPIHLKPSNYDPLPSEYGMPLHRHKFDNTEPRGHFVYGSYKDCNEMYNGPFPDPIVLTQHRGEYSLQPPDQPLHEAHDEEHDMKDVIGRCKRSSDEIAMKNGSAINPLDSIPRYINQQIGTQFDQQTYQQAERVDEESGTNKVEGSLKTCLEELKETLDSLESKISTQSMLVEDAQKMLKKRKRVQSIAQTIRKEVELTKIQNEYNSLKKARKESLECFEKNLEKQHLDKYAKLVKDFHIKKQEELQNEEQYRCVSTWTMLDVNARFITAVEKKVGHEMMCLDLEIRKLEQENEQVTEENKSLVDTLKNEKAKDSHVMKVKEALDCFMEDWRKRVTFLEGIKEKLDIVGKSFNKLYPVSSFLISNFYDGSGKSRINEGLLVILKLLLNDKSRLEESMDEKILPIVDKRYSDILKRRKISFENLVKLREHQFSHRMKKGKDRSRPDVPIPASRSVNTISEESSEDLFTDDAIVVSELSGTGTFVSDEEDCLYLSDFSL